MAKGKETLLEILIDEYEKNIPVAGGKKDEHGSLNDEQKRLIADCTAGGIEPEQAAAKLPALKPWAGRGGKIDDCIYNNKAKGEIPAVLRFLRLVFAAGGSEYVSAEVHEFVEWEHRGVTRKDIFGDGKLTPLMELNFLFYELYDDTREYEMDNHRTEIDGVYEKNPGLFKEIAAMKGHPFASLRAAVYLYRKGDSAMEKCIAEIVQPLAEIDDDFCFTLAAENGFTHPALREKLKENFIKHPVYMSSRIGWNLHHCDKYLDRGLIVKKRNDENEDPAKMDYILKMCRDLGIQDVTAYHGIIGEFSRYNKQELADFMKPLSHAEFENAISWLRGRNGEYQSIDDMLALVTVCDRRPPEDYAVLTDILAACWDNLIREQVISCIEDSGDKEKLERYFFKNEDPAILDEIEHSDFGDMPCCNEVGDLFGYFAGEAAVSERVHRYAQFIMMPGQLHPAAHFTRSLWRKYHWEADKFADYFLDSPVNLDYKIIFLDELCCPDSVREPKKETPVYLDEVAEALRKGGQKFLFAHKEETHRFIEGGEDFWDFALLTCYYYGHSKEADPRPVLAIMGAKQKLVKKRILETLAGYPEIRGEVEKLAESKNKQVRTTAGAVLAQWDEMSAQGLLQGGAAAAGANADTSFDPTAWAEKNMPTSVKKLLAFTDPATWPAVRFASGI